MEEQTKSKRQTIVFAVISILVSMFAANSPALAQTTYKIGDRVEAQPFCCQWKKATIIEIAEWNGQISGVLVAIDNEKDSSGAPMKYTVGLNMLRPLQETAAEKQAVAEKQAAIDASYIKLKVDENNTVLPDRELLDCDSIEQPKAKNGAAPNAKILEKLIRCLWERPAVSKGTDGAVTIDLTPLQIGASRKWNVDSDIGSGGTANTLVFPVKTTYTQRTFYRTTVEERVYTGVFNCYVNTFGEWQCGSADSRQKGETKKTPVAP